MPLAGSSRSMKQNKRPHYPERTRGTQQLLDDRGDRECFASSCRAQQDLVFESVVDAFDKLPDGFRLVAGGLEGSVKFEVHCISVEWRSNQNNCTTLF
jgi:hypothetical protein